MFASNNYNLFLIAFELHSLYIFLYYVGYMCIQFYLLLIIYAFVSTFIQFFKQISLILIYFTFIYSIYMLTFASRK